MPTQDDKARAFRALHEGPPFIIPNPWDAGSAHVLEAIGFKALATTSSGFAFTLGRPDGSVTLDEIVEHTRLLCDTTTLPVSVDLENGYGDEPGAAAKAITSVAEAGAVGGSIEDWDGTGAIYEQSHAVERIAAAAEASRKLDFPFTLTARAENLIHGVDDIDDTIARLQAYEQAGADVVFAPGLADAEQIKSVAHAVTKPLNVLAVPTLTMDDIAGAGAQRISVGGRLTWVAAGAMATAAKAMLDNGDFSVLHAEEFPRPGE